MSSYVYGVNAVRESFKSGRVIKVFHAERLQDHPLVAEMARTNIPLAVKDDRSLTRMAGSLHHQGVVAEVSPLSYATFQTLLSKSKDRKHPLILLLDGLKDPHNLGAILRSCDAFGVDGVILKKKNEVPLNETVARVSTGAINYVDVVAVANLSQAIRELKKNGFWIVSTDGSAQTSVYDLPYDMPTALVVGSEGEGISRLVLDNSDFVVKIPMMGHVNSLNASVSCGIALAAIRYKQS